jgi:hypothetical protein
MKAYIPGHRNVAAWLGPHKLSVLTFPMAWFGADGPGVRLKIPGFTGASGMRNDSGGAVIQISRSGAAS